MKLTIKNLPNCPETDLLEDAEEKGMKLWHDWYPLENTHTSYHYPPVYLCLFLGMASIFIENTNRDKGGL